MISPIYNDFKGTYRSRRIDQLVLTKQRNRYFVAPQPTANQQALVVDIEIASTPVNLTAHFN